MLRRQSRRLPAFRGDMRRPRRKKRTSSTVWWSLSKCQSLQPPPVMLTLRDFWSFKMFFNVLIIHNISIVINRRQKLWWERKTQLAKETRSELKKQSEELQKLKMEIRKKEVTSRHGYQGDSITPLWCLSPSVWVWSSSGLHPMWKKEVFPSYWAEM